MADDFKVSVISIASLGGPDVLDFFVRLGPALDSFVRLGQIAVAIATVFYITQKFRNARAKRPTRLEECDES